MKTDRDCVGCLACYNSCPKQAISVVQNKDGFYRPIIESDKCIKCGLCDHICNLVFKKQKNHPLKSIIFSNHSIDVLNNSSSGGGFHSLASIVLQSGGVVFAAGFDEQNNVIHMPVHSLDKLFLVTRSKYVQSFIGETYKQIRSELLKSKMVLFCGTPCQVSALKSFLNDKNYDNLILVDFICHGVPSPSILKEHLANISCGKTIKQGTINFRDKRNGIDKYGLSVQYEDGSEYYASNHDDRFLFAFQNNHFLQNSCYSCKFKRIKCASDITISDMWNKSVYEKNNRFKNLDCSCIIANTNKGVHMLEQLYSYGEKEYVNISDELAINTSRLYPSSRPAENVLFSENNGHFVNHESIFFKVKRKIHVTSRLFLLRRRSEK